MSHPRRHVLFVLLFAFLLAASLTIPHRMAASPVSDFVAPMSAQAAQARIRVAQQADTQRRDAIARNLGAHYADSLCPAIYPLFSYFFAHVRRESPDAGGRISATPDRRVPNSAHRLGLV